MRTRSTRNDTITPMFMLATMGSATLPDTSVGTPARARDDMQAVLDELGSLGGKPMEQLTVEEARRQPTPADAVKALLEKRGLATAPEAVANVEDKMIPGAGGEIPIRVYTPQGHGPFPVILYIHGGGWVIADLDTYDSSPRALANSAEAIVVSTHYRQAPEHPFPASHEDVFAAYVWVLENAGSLGGDPQRVAVAGESAGGNMAAAISLMARQRNLPMPVYQVLVYPLAGTDMNTPSYQENAFAKPLNKAMMAWFVKQVFKRAEDMADSRIDLIHADLHGLPPATIIAAEIDPLRSEGKALADALEAAGVSVEYKLYDGVTHEFFGMGALVDEGRAAVQLAAKNLKRAFEPAMASR